jgi:hypothetical protein
MTPLNQIISDSRSSGEQPAISIAVMQPYCFPYIGYFQLIHSVDRFIFYDQLSYIRHGWINRNRILQANAGPLFFIVPVLSESARGNISDVVIDNRTGWFRKTRKMIELNYRRAPFFDQVMPLIDPFLTGRINNLSKLNCESTEAICRFLDMDTETVSGYDPALRIEKDLHDSDSVLMRDYFERWKLADRKSIRILEICRHENAAVYINAAGGANLYDKAVFARAGLDVYFINTRPVAYRQMAADFHSNLSIIDVLMNCGKDGTRKLLGEYDVI